MVRGLEWFNRENRSIDNIDESKRWIHIRDERIARWPEIAIQSERDDGIDNDQRRLDRDSSIELRLMLGVNQFIRTRTHFLNQSNRVAE